MWTGGLYQSHHDGTRWVEVQQCVNGEPNTAFPFFPQMGMSCALLGRTAFGGAPFGHGTTQNSAGAAYLFELSDIGLDAVPDVVPPLGTLTLETTGGLALADTGIFVVDVNGVPFSPILLLFIGSFDADGRYSLSLPLPASVSGLELNLLGAGFWKPGQVGFSGLVHTRFE